MFMERIDVHKSYLEKAENDLGVNDCGELHRQYPSLWACLVDKGYVGLGNSIRAIHPKK